MKQVTIKLRDIGASLVEMGLLLVLIALVAIPSVKKLGAANRCQICKYTYCKINGGPDCRSPGDIIWKTDCVDDYYGGFDSVCE